MLQKVYLAFTEKLRLPHPRGILDMYLGEPNKPRLVYEHLSSGCNQKSGSGVVSAPARRSIRLPERRMSESSAPAQSPLAAASAFKSNSADYQLSDDLARLCLPQEFKDSYRTLAWVNSICFLFLVVGLIGLKHPKVIQKPLSEVVETVPVIFTPPEEQPKAEPEVKPDEEQPQDVQTETPQVVAVVAAADSSSVAFAVPVQGAVAIAPTAALASPPPPVTHTPPPKAVQFNPNSEVGGSFPEPKYPQSALRNQYQGTVIIEFVVDPSGQVASVKVQKSSGFPILDEEALSTVKNRWRFTPGTARYFFKPFVFQLQ
jgi:protein TonB